MSKYPWGPHGQEVSPNTVKPNPTAFSPAQQIEDASFSAEPVSAGGGGGLGGVLAQILFGLVMVAILWIPMVCLYTVSVLPAIGVGWIIASVSARLLPADGGDVATLLGVVAGAVVLFFMFRVELRLSEISTFRIARHGVRLVLLGIWAIPIIMLSTGVTAPTTTTRFILAVVSSPRVMAQFLLNPVNLGILAAVLVVLHFLLWKGERFRRFWHRRLVFVGLK